MPLGKDRVDESRETVGVTTVVALLAVTGGLSRRAGNLAKLGRTDFGVFSSRPITTSRMLVVADTRFRWPASTAPGSRSRTLVSSCR